MAIPAPILHYPHVEVEGHETPTIAGSRIKVVFLAEAHRSHGYSAEELHEHYPHLPKAAIYSALAYYWDHQEAMDAEIERRRQSESELRSWLEDPALRDRLRSRLAARAETADGADR
jgi:uncharacterized protein (DUF433 family)